MDRDVQKTEKIEEKRLTPIGRILNIRSRWGERNTGSVEVSGSIPLGSTNF